MKERMQGRLVKAWRESAGFTQEQFAEAAGFTRSQIGDYERGRSEPAVKTLLRLIAAIERIHGVTFGKDMAVRFACFYLGPERLARNLIVAKEVIRLGSRRRRR